MHETTRVALLIADLHLTLVQPACRADDDWMAVQANYLEQVRRMTIPPVLENSRQAVDPLPVLCAGDIFDRWNPSPELINFALKHLPTGMLCVPGQHDLPNHRIDDMHRSGYGVLTEAKKIVDLSSARAFTAGTFAVHGFGWEQRILPFDEETDDDRIHVALIHRYCWQKDASFPGAPEENNVGAYKKALRGYDVAVFGDNHKHFIANAGNCTVYNCGGFIRRKSDELDAIPYVGVLYSDGTVKRRKLDTSADKFHDAVEERKEVPLDVKQFLDNLAKLGEHGLDFREAVKNHLRKDDISPSVREIVMEALDSHGTD